jgi:hypothetical protein
LELHVTGAFRYHSREAISGTGHLPQADQVSDGFMGARKARTPRRAVNARKPREVAL